MERLKRILRMESFSGLLLFSFAILAIVFDNTALHTFYNNLFHTTLTIHYPPIKLQKSLLHWVNDGLMALYFLLVGLEIKREVCRGSLTSIRHVALPLVGALGGLVLPAIIFLCLNKNHPQFIRGWAIPCATDIAFSLGILALVGKRLHFTARIFLSALAIIDDIAAVIIIAVFYTQNIVLMALVAALVCYAVLIMLNLSKVKMLWPYCLIGIIMWYAVLKSGVHATIAGVMLATTIPFHDDDHPDETPLKRLEVILHPWATFFILPVFAFANAGFSFDGLEYSHFLNPLPLGIALGLFIGKQLGIFGSCYAMIKMRLAKLPDKLDLRQLYGIALICGVGFTMSLFIGGLAFGAHGDLSRLVRIGVLAGSILSGLCGWLLLRVCSQKPPQPEIPGL